MAKVFTNKTSFSLLKTNPKLTGNLKLVVDSNGDIYIETIDASPELTRNKYKKVKLDLENDWSTAIYNLFNSGSIPESILYGIKDNEDFFSIKNSFAKQYYTNYQQGATPKISKLYDEQISYLAPIWLEPNDVPEYFAIFKIPNPVSVNTKNQQTPFDENTEKEIYNTNYFENEENSNYFFETILKNAKLHKVFDMGPDSTIGTFLRNHINDERMPESSLTIDWNINKQSTVNGISLRKSGFTNESFNMFSEAFPVDRTITEFDNLITNQFSINGVIHPNIINLEFLFDDESNEDFEINRYFGLYFNRNDITNFKLDSAAFYTKKYNNLPQNKNIESVYDVNILSDNNIALENESGVKLFVDYDNQYELLSSDIKNSNFLPYVYSTDDTFYDIKNDVDWNSNELVLKNTFVNTRDLKGFTKESLGIIPASKSNQEGRSYFEFKIEGTTNSFELRIRNVNENSSEFNINQVFIGDVSLTAGSFINNKFSLAGNPEEIANAITTAINNYANQDEDFNIFSISKFDRVIVFTRGTNQYWNNYEYLMFSDDVNFSNVVSVPYENFESITNFNIRRNTLGQPNFIDYSAIVSGATSMYEDPSFLIIQQKFKGGNDIPQNRIRIPKEFESYFSTNLFLKTIDWYTKIDSISAYLDEPIFQNGRIVNFDDFDSYISINCSDDIKISNGGYCEIFDVETNKVGLMSMYPIKQFDIDQFRSEYGKDGDGYLELLSENYLNKAGDIGSFSLTIQNAIQNFRDSGFKKLGGSLNEDTGEIQSITNEYDRLLENELPELAIKGRIIPFINKWVYDDGGSDVRENNYRLSNNSAFSYDNFSPSNVNKIPDFRFFTHEWYYLQEYPYYLTTEQKIDSFSYFDRYLEKTELYDISQDRFTEYFTQYNVDGVSFPMMTKYTIVSGGNEDSFGETFFRGAKIKFKRRVENKNPLNFNIQDLGVFSSDEFNDYKFSAVFTNKTNEPIAFSVIENKKFKTITMFIEADLDDYYLSRGTTGQLFLDRCLLYVIENKYNNTGDFADIKVSGAISPFIENEFGTNVPNFTIESGVYVINGSQNIISNSLPNFDKQILPNEQGVYNKIVIELTSNTSIIIDQISSITKNTIRARKFFYKLGTTEYPFGLSYINLYPLPEDCLDKIPTYESGGFNAFKGTIQEISFASIFDKINNGSPDIEYVTINENGTVDKNTFLLEFDLYSTNTKADYITTEPIIFNGVKNSDFKPIGVKTSGLNSTYISTMYRFNGRYNPKVQNVMLYRDNYDNKFTSDIRNSLRFTNVQFFSTYPNFALYKQLYINKINEQNPLTILDLNKGSALRPQFWKIGEISIDKQDSYIFRSCWDHNFHKKYNSKFNFTSYPGYIEPKEISSFLASSIMNIPELIKLEKYTYNPDLLSPVLDIRLTRNSNNNISGVLNNTKKIIETIKPRLVSLFETYVNPNFNYNVLDSLDDDIERYITTNILPRYFSQNVYAYVKYSSKLSNEPLFESNMTEQELLTNGFTKLENIRFSRTRFSEFEYKFTFIKPSDKNVTLSFITNITVV